MRKIETMTSRRTKCALLSSAALVVGMTMSSGAMAQNCVTSNPLRGGFKEIGNLAASTASSISGSIGNINTVFLTQQTSAFVAAPSNAPPATQGGGVWVRGLGGEVEVSSKSATAAAQTPVINPAIDSGTIACTSTERLNFSGVQVGRDISGLNLLGYNVHWGTTAGYLEAKGKELETGVGQLRSKFEVPFAGLYGVITKDGFFADVNLRYEYYNINLENSALSLHDLPFTAHGWSLTTGAGYNWALGDGWFVEPSAGGIFSRTSVESFNNLGLPPGQLGSGLSGTLSFDPIYSAIGRGTLRVGRNFTAGAFALQPFVTASVFHEFAGDTAASFVTCPNCAFVGATAVTADFRTQTSRVGTWGQYSVGLAGQLINTGWLGFVRGDYRNGEHIDGWTVNAGLRYQYTPDPVVAPAKFSKGPQPPVVVAAPIYWTGFYLGGYFGGAYGTTDVGYAGLATTDPTVSGWIGGGQIGYNYQVGRWVFGVEGDIGSSNIHGHKTCGNSNGQDANGISVGFSPFFLTCGSNADWIATAAARVGWTWDRALFYVKGGAAWTDETVSVGCVLGPSNPFVDAGVVVRSCRNPGAAIFNGYDVSASRSGWMLAYGSEYAFNQNWSAKAEYKYIDFGSKDYVAPDGYRLHSDLQVSTVTVGLNYRFSPWAAPVIAKY